MPSANRQRTRKLAAFHFHLPSLMQARLFSRTLLMSPSVHRSLGNIVFSFAASAAPEGIEYHCVEARISEPNSRFPRDPTG